MSEMKTTLMSESMKNRSGQDTAKQGSGLIQSGKVNLSWESQEVQAGTEHHNKM